MGDIQRLKELSGDIGSKLRKKKLEQGKPFLIRSSKLPKDQNYLEFPNHIIKIVIVSPDRRSFDVVEEFTIKESKKILKELNLV